MLRVDEEALFNQYLSDKINLFLGAGFSVLARNAGNESLPLGAKLKSKILEEFSRPELNTLDLQSIYAVISSTHRDQITDYLKQIYTVSSFSPEYDALRLLDISSIYTTNIDDLCYHIFGSRPGQRSKVLHDSYIYSLPARPNDVISYIPLHGSVTHDPADYVFSAGQIASAFASDRETWYVFQKELRSRPTLFIGYAVRDAGVLQALYTGSSPSANRWVLLRPDEIDAKPYFESMGFKALIGETQDVLKYISKLVEASAADSPSFTKTPRYGAIPTVMEAAARPVVSFFLGAEPEWSDAYSSQIVRRRLFSRVKNAVLSGKNVAIVGIPLSGKTTVLKQVACDVNQIRSCLYFDRISLPVAEEIIAEHSVGPKKTILFIDDLIDSREALKLITKSGRFQIVSTETSFYFDTMNLKPVVGEITVIPSSEVDLADRQKILDSIPLSIKRHTPISRNFLLDSNDEVGLFEALREYVYDQKLIDRFRAKLRQFEQKDREAFDLYLMACYVARCRTVVSYDMMYMFLDKKNKKYGDVYAITDRIGDFLREVDLEEDPHQDYFSIRSSALGRIALDQASNSAFQRVFERFHAAVPANVIPEHRVFRRYAYDNDFARRAFPDAKRGKAFYERLISQTENPYDYQHGAVYLSKMRQFKDAFAWIDKALSLSGARIFAIRNSHAVILFEANIGVVRDNRDDYTARAAIKESMDVLNHCIKNDARRNYHLMRFADQALQYVQIFQDHDAMDWLRLSQAYLKDALKEAAAPGSRESYNQAKFRRILARVEQDLPVASRE